MNVGHLPLYTDLVAVEVVGLLADFSVFVDGVSIGVTAYICTTHALRQDWRLCIGCGLFTIKKS